MNKLREIIAKELFLVLLALIFTVLVVLKPLKPAQYLKFIDYEMLGILLIMMILTEALRLSGIFSYLANRLVARFTKKRHIALALSLFSAFLATFLTNDITLFIVLPLVLNLKQHFNRKFWLLVVYILIAVNIGSALTPVGNPQNIIIWRKWDIDFDTFVLKMLPLFLLLVLLLTAFILLTFKNERIDTDEPINFQRDTRLFYISMAWLLVFIIAVELNTEEVFFVLIPLFYAFYNRQTLKSIDWGILALFVFIFLDFNIISTFDVVKNLLNGQTGSSAGSIFLAGAALSQIISNVPATVLLANLTDNWLALAWGVNVGAQGLIIGSLANLIGVRLTRENNLTLKYHLIGVPFFIVSGFASAWLLNYINF